MNDDTNVLYGVYSEFLRALEYSEVVKMVHGLKELSMLSDELRRSIDMVLDNEYKAGYNKAIRNGRVLVTRCFECKYGKPVRSDAEENKVHCTKFDDDFDSDFYCGKGKEDDESV